MTVKELIIELEYAVSKGYRDKDIFVEEGEDNYHIDSVQSNRNPGIEPEYLFLMAGERKEENDD